MVCMCWCVCVCVNYVTLVLFYSVCDCPCHMIGSDTLNLLCKYSTVNSSRFSTSWLLHYVVLVGSLCSTGCFTMQFWLVHFAVGLETS